MAEPQCKLCWLRDAPQGQHVFRAVHCCCRLAAHAPLDRHPHVQRGCIGYTPPAVEIVGSIDRYVEAHHAD